MWRAFARTSERLDQPGQSKALSSSAFRSISLRAALSRKRAGRGSTKSDRPQLRERCRVGRSPCARPDELPASHRRGPRVLRIHTKGVKRHLFSARTALSASLGVTTRPSGVLHRFLACGRPPNASRPLLAPRSPCRRCGVRCPELFLVFAVAVTVDVLEADLAAGRSRCPGCGGPLPRWGFARERQVRMLEEVQWVRPLPPVREHARAAGGVGGARRHDGAEAIGLTLLAHARANGHGGDRRAAGTPTGDGAQLAARVPPAGPKSCAGPRSDGRMRSSRRSCKLNPPGSPPRPLWSTRWATRPEPAGWCWARGRTMGAHSRAHGRAAARSQPHHRTSAARLPHRPGRASGMGTDECRSASPRLRSWSCQRRGCRRLGGCQRTTRPDEIDRTRRAGLSFRRSVVPRPSVANPSHGSMVNERDALAPWARAIQRRGAKAPTGVDACTRPGLIRPTGFDQPDRGVLWMAST
jgi:hypothetical protein